MIQDPILASTPLMRSTNEIAIRFYNFGVGMQLTHAYQQTVRRMTAREAEIEELRKQQLELQFERNLKTCGLPNWGWNPEPEAPSEEEQEVLNKLTDLCIAQCHDLKSMEFHSAQVAQLYGES